MKQGLLGAVTALTLLTAGCTTTTPTPGAQVFAAASLSTVGTELAKAYRAEHPGAEITFHFAGSSALVRQIDEGAPVDLFISADRTTMDKALELEEFAGAPAEVIATNHLVLATAAGNPAGITELADITDALVARCAPEVPCGTLTEQVLDGAGVELGRSSEEANVSDVAMKVATGVVDAGFIYSTDARALDSAAVIDLPSSNEYPMAVSATGRENEVAVDFARFLSSAQAQGILAGYGFGTD